MWVGALAIALAICVIKDMVDPLISFWSDPPKRTRRYAYYVDGDQGRDSEDYATAEIFSPLVWRQAA